jgi:ribosome biogenesis protein SSF1/2
MNNFTTPTSDAKSKIPRHLESLTTTVFQSIFPAINPQHTPLKSIKRVLLVNRETLSSDIDSFVLNFRHYAITTKKAGSISRAAKRLDAAEKMLNAKSSRKGALPNLSRLQDIADFMMDEDGRSGYTTDATSGSEMDTDNEVEVLRDVPAKVATAKARATAAQYEENGQPAPDQEDGVERLAVKLVDLGPRMRLRLTKVEEGLCSGKVMWHEYLHKSKDEVRALDQKWEQRRKEKEARRKLQKENIEKKKQNRAAASAKAEEEDVPEDGEDWSEDEDLFSEMDGDEFDSEGLAGDADEAAHVDAKHEA